MEGKHQSAKVEKKSGVGKTSQALSSSEEGEEKSQIAVMEDQAYDNQLEIAELGTIAAELGIERENQKQFLDFLTSTIDSGVDSVMNDSWTHALDLVKAEEAKAKSKGVAVPDSVSSRNKALASYAQGILDKLSQKQASAAALIVEGDRIATDTTDKDPKIRKQGEQAIQKQRSLADPNSSHDVATMSHALGVLGNLSVPRGKAAPVVSPKEVDNLIYNVWQKVAAGEFTAEQAQEICKYVQEYRPVAVKIGKLTADISSTESPILKEVKANLAAIDWDSQQDVSKKLGKVVKVIQDQKAEKSEQEVEAIKQAFAALAAQMIMSSVVREKALKKLDHIVKNSKDAALVDYADSILAKVKSASALRANTKQIAPTLAAKGEKASRTTDLFLSVHSKALIMEEAVQDRRTPSPQQFKDLRSDALKLLTIQDTKALG
ncbi:MAG: hypothetical protein ABIH22_02750, partial [Candidatus Margulisiibacteriota bacterium]